MHCHATVCALPHFMPLARPRLERRLPCENWSCRVGKRCRSPHWACLLPPAWVIETWKPVGGCKFTGYFPGAAGNSALRFCLPLKWRAIRLQANELFPAQLQGDSLSCLPAENNDADVESVSTPSSDTFARRAERLTQAIERDST